MANRPSGNRHQTIHCDICGEDYAATYKRCPFCDGKPPSADGKAAPRREKRNNRGGGYSTPPTPARILTTVISLAFIVAAVCIVVSIVRPFIGQGDPDTISSAFPSESVTPTPENSVEPSADPTIPPDQTATGLTLDQSDFTLQSYGQTVTIHAAFSPEGSKGYVTWTSSNPEVVSVDENGTVTGLGKSGGVGSATITATLTGTQISQSCIVRCSFNAPAGASTPGASSSPAPSNSGSGAASGSLSLNRDDFTLNATWPTFQMEVSGAASTPTWSIANTAIATVDSSGKVTRVGIGTTTLTCSVDGQTLTCIVRCN